MKSYTIEQLRIAAERDHVPAQFELGWCYATGQGVQQNFSEAVKWYRKAAEQGDTDAQCLLGGLYHDGTGVQQDHVAAVMWLRRAAEQGNATAQFLVGISHARGEGVPQNYSEAVKWFRKAAEQDIREAQTCLGDCYHEGNGVPKDYTEAVTWMRKAAEKGYAKAQYSLGFSFYEGEGIQKNYSEAATWYRKAAEQGDADAQCCLGGCYFDGKGVQRDQIEAAAWYRKAAEQGNAFAQYNLGECFYEGAGVPQNFTEAALWIQKAAEQGVAAAQDALGVCFSKGEGVLKNTAEAFRWFQRAAEQGDHWAQLRLGLSYKSGSGIEQNNEEAVKWFRQASELGNTCAMNRLGECFYNGEGIAENCDEAVALFRRAAESNDSDAQFHLGECYCLGTGVAQNVDEAEKYYHKAAAQGHAEAQFWLGLCAKHDDLTEAYSWFVISASSGDTGVMENALKACEHLRIKMTPEQIARAEQRAKEFQQVLTPQFNKHKRSTVLSASLSDVLKRQSTGRLNSWIETLPFPLASILRAWQASSDADLDKKVRQLANFFEATTAFIAFIFMSAFNSQVQKREIITFLCDRERSFKKTDFGTWKEVIEHWGSEVRRQIKGPKEHRAQCAEIFANQNLQLPEVLSSVELLEIIKRTNKIRNEVVHPIRVLAPAEALIFHERLKADLERLRDVMGNLWTNMQLVRPLGNHKRCGRFENEVEILMGSNSTFLPRTMPLHEALDEGHLHIVCNNGDRALQLVPLVRMDPPPSSVKNTCYFYSETDRDDLLFIAYPYDQKRAYPKQEAQEVLSLFEGI